MVDSDANTIHLEDTNIKCPFRLKKSYISQSIQSTKKDLEVIVIFFLITVLNLFPNQNLSRLMLTLVL